MLSSLLDAVSVSLCMKMEKSLVGVTSNAVLSFTSKIVV